MKSEISTGTGPTFEVLVPDSYPSPLDPASLIEDFTDEEGNFLITDDDEDEVVAFNVSELPWDMLLNLDPLVILLCRIKHEELTPDEAILILSRLITRAHIESPTNKR